MQGISCGYVPPRFAGIPAESYCKASKRVQGNWEAVDAVTCDLRSLLGGKRKFPVCDKHQPRRGAAQ